MSTAEKKLLIVFVYYIFMQVIVFIYFSQTQQAGPSLAREIALYFSCEQSGFDPNSPCDRSGFEALISPPLQVLAFAMALLVPIISFVFVVDCNMLKQKVKDVKSKLVKMSDMNELETNNGMAHSKANYSSSHELL